MFRGVSELSLDDKGRLAIPTRYRDHLQTQASSQCVITIDTEESCLLIYPFPEWERIEKQLEALPSFNRAARRVQRLLIGHATETNMDASGRVLIPVPLREFAMLKKDVVLIGQGHRFELWDREHWSACRSEWLNQEAEDEIPQSLLSISL